MLADHNSGDTYLGEDSIKVKAQWLERPARNHKVAGSRPATAMSLLGIGSLNHN
jgi:hypothetical protein